MSPIDFIVKTITGLIAMLLSLGVAALVAPDEGILGQIYMLVVLVFWVIWWSWEP